MTTPNEFNASTLEQWAKAAAKSAPGVRRGGGAERVSFHQPSAAIAATKAEIRISKGGTGATTRGGLKNRSS